MKLKIYITLLSLFVINALYSQVGIGTTNPNTSSILEISSANSGLLIPRVSLLSTTDVATITTPAVSLLVYNSGFAPNGFYYWNGTIWVQLTQSNNAWSLNGNTGTASATNFFGTIDDVDIVLKRNNIRAGFIGNPNTSGGNKNTSFGANSLNAAGTGIRNTAIGSNVMPSNTSGQLNVSIGDQSMFLNQGGSTNTAIGVGTLYSNVAGNENVALGRNALTSANASFNTALGFAALRSNVTGTNNVAIGHQAGYNETGSNKLYIENSTTANGSDSSANNALIYGEFDNRIVRANATMQIGNPAVSGYALPTTRGTSGQFLQTDGTGTTSWVTSVAVLPYSSTGTATGVYNVTLAQHTVRVFGTLSEVRLPTPVGNLGKVFVIIGSNLIGTKIFSTAAGNIYDDVAAGNVTTLSANQRYTVQSDGTDWIVIGN